MDTSTLLSVLALIGAAFVFFRSGGSRASAEVLSTFKMQVGQLKDDVAELKEREREHLGEIGKLKGALEEKEKRLDMYEKIITNRNPEMTKFMEYLTKVASESETFMMHTTDEISGTMQLISKLDQNLDEIKNFMQKINLHMTTMHRV